VFSAARDARGLQLRCLYSAAALPRLCRRAANNPAR